MTYQVTIRVAGAVEMVVGAFHSPHKADEAIARWKRLDTFSTRTFEIEELVKPATADARIKADTYAIQRVEDQKQRDLEAAIREIERANPKPISFE
jgi:hypothetical protein